MESEKGTNKKKNNDDVNKITLSDQKYKYIELLDLNQFKTKKCTVQTNTHNLKRCPDYHDKTKDRRRTLGNYRSELCAFIAKKKACP
jgi:hypothetical protein